MKIDDYLKNYKKKDVKHALFVADMAEVLYERLTPFFDELKPLKNQLHLLITAAKLHDIGKFDKSAPHNKTGAKMVMENGIEGLSAQETLIVANLIRYHRGKHPKDKHTLYSQLENKELVRIFASILKIADVLDYGHFSAAEDISVALKGDEIVLNITSNPASIKDFTEAFDKKKLLFEEVFGKNISV